MAKYLKKKYSFKGYIIKETPEGTFDIFRPSWCPYTPLIEELSDLEYAKEWIKSDLKLEENDGGGGSGFGGGTAFGDAGGSATYDAPAFGKADKSIIKKEPYTICGIKENIIRPVVEKYLEKYF